MDTMQHSVPLKEVVLHMGMISSISQPLPNTRQVYHAAFILLAMVHLHLGIIVRTETTYSKCDILYAIDLWSL